MRALALVLLLPLLSAADACSLVGAHELQATWLGPDAVVTNVGNSFVRIGFDGKVTGLHAIELQAWRAPVVDPQGTWMVVSDQRGLGADCSGHSYTLLLDARTGNQTRSWDPALEVWAGTPEGFIAHHDRAWHLHAWDGDSVRPLASAPERDHVAAYAAGRLAWAADGMVKVTQVDSGTTTDRWDAGPPIDALAIDGAGRVAVLVREHTTTGETLRLVVDGAEAWSHTGESGAGPHRVAAFDGGWLVTNGTAAWFAGKGEARVVAEGARVPAVVADPDGTRAAVAVADGEGDAVELRLLLPGLVPGPVLRPGGSGWDVEAPRHAPTQESTTRSAAAPPLAGMALAAVAAGALLRIRSRDPAQ